MTEQHRGVPVARLAALGALLVALLTVAWLMLSGGDETTYRLQFQNAGQLVAGNQVLVGGQPIGSIEEIDLSDDSQAEVTISVSQPLHEGTTAVIRASSLSGVANRYVSISPGPNSEPELSDGDVIAADKTTAPVDLDQLFNTFSPRAQRGLRDVIQGQAAVYDGNAEAASRTYKFLSPSLSSSERVFAELTRDQQVFTDFLVETSAVMTALGERRTELSSLVANANTSMAAIARENAALDRTLVELAPTLRQGSTTFLDLRTALDDVDDLVDATKPVAPRLVPFFRDLRPAVTDAVPVFADLRSAVDRAGLSNDLTDAMDVLPRLRRKARDSSRASIEALVDSQPVIEFARPYTPELMGWIKSFGQATANYDANGHYARVQPANQDLFSFDSGSGALSPIPASEQAAGIDFALNERCPGAATQRAMDGSTPFLDGGALGGLCDSTQFPPGP